MNTKVPNKRVLFVYNSLANTGLSSKADKIEAGFVAKNCVVKSLYYCADRSKVSQLTNLITIQLSYLFHILIRRYDVVYIRYSYYFIFIFFVSLLLGRKIQIELNGNIQEELIVRGQKFRAAFDAVSFWFAVKSSSKIHLSSKELSVKYQRKYPKSTVVFTPNFVVDEYYDEKAHSNNKERVNLVFLGNTEQKWHGMYEFIDTVMVGEPWFSENCCLHIVGKCSKDVEKLLKDNQLDDSVVMHDFLSGEKKHQVMAEMDIGLSSFMLKVKGLSETTGIKTGEYLFSGLAIILGYVDQTVSPDLPFCLSIDISDKESSCDQVKSFIQLFKSTPDLSNQAHDYAKNNLLVGRYINNIVS